MDPLPRLDSNQNINTTSSIKTSTIFAFCLGFDKYPASWHNDTDISINRTINNLLASTEVSLS